MLIQKNRIYSAYYYEGEREFNNLSILFGLSKVKVDSGDTVVIISDKRKPDQQNEGSESVYSPIFDAGTKLRRRLFDEGVSGDNASTFEKHPNHNNLGPDGEIVRRMGRPLPPRTDNKCMPPTYSPNGSTCGSANRWWLPK